MIYCRTKEDCYILMKNRFVVHKVCGCVVSVWGCGGGCVSVGEADSETIWKLACYDLLPYKRGLLHLNEEQVCWS